MRPRELWSLLVAAGAMVACSEHPSGVTGKVVVAPDTAVTMTLGQSVAVSATVDGHAVSVSVRLRAEQRWLNDRSVLDSAALGAARLQARAPGQAVVEVIVGAHTDSLSVSVIPPRPSVVETRLPGGRVHLGDGDTITLRGYRMERVTGANIAAGTAATTIVSQDSASLRFIISSAANGACTGTADRFTLRLFRHRR
jgi:hypothetical protein